jgi:hypothetical protein
MDNQCDASATSELELSEEQNAYEVKAAQGLLAAKQMGLGTAIGCSLLGIGGSATRDTQMIQIPR